MLDTRYSYIGKCDIQIQDYVWWKPAKKKIESTQISKRMHNLTVLSETEKSSI